MQRSTNTVVVATALIYGLLMIAPFSLLLIATTMTVNKLLLVRISSYCNRSSYWYLLEVIAIATTIGTNNRRRLVLPSMLIVITSSTAVVVRRHAHTRSHPRGNRWMQGKLGRKRTILEKQTSARTRETFVDMENVTAFMERHAQQQYASTQTTT